MKNRVRTTIGGCLVLLLVAGGTLFYRLGELPLTGADEPRYARIAEEMDAAGRWVTPILQGHPWLEKPPLYYWLTIPIFAGIGVNEWTARLAPALSALAVCWMLYGLGRRLYGGLAGFYGAAILLTSLGFVAFGRSASTDMPFTAAQSGALAIFCLAASRPETSRSLLASAYVLLALAVLAKGPVAVILALGIGFLFWWLDSEENSTQRWRPVAGLLLLLALALPWFWFAFRENGFSFIASFLIHHNLARFVSEIHHHAQPFYYYIPILLGLFFPWSGWLPLLARRPLFHRPRERGTLFLFCWWIFPLIFFSLSSSKLPGYILPCLPPLALLLGKEFAEQKEERARDVGKRFAPMFFLCFSVAVAAAIFGVYRIRYGGGVAGGIVIAISILIPAAVAFGLFWTRRLNWVLPATVAQGLFLVLALTHFAFPVLASHHSTRQIATESLAKRQSGEPIVTYRFFHHTLHYYTGYQIDEDLQDLRSLERYLEAHPRILVVTEARRAEELRRLPGFHATELAQQAKLRLYLLTHNSGDGPR